MNLNFDDDMQLSENSIIVDASKYIQELKHKVERLNQDIITTVSQSNSGNKTSSWPASIYIYIFLDASPLLEMIKNWWLILYFVLQQIEVETLEKGFLINVYAERSCPGLLVAILQVLEDLGLNVLEARVSCNDTFRLQAFGGEVINSHLLLLFNLQIKPPFVFFFFFFPQ